MQARRRPAYTLLELVIALTLVAILLGMAAPPLTRALAYTRVRTARDVVAGEAARARALAVARGGGALVLDLGRGRVWVEAADTVTPERIAAERPVRMVVDGSRADTVRIGYDAMGLGRLANRTVRFEGGGVEAGLVLSQYGRVRTW